MNTSRRWHQNGSLPKFMSQIIWWFCTADYTTSFENSITLIHMTIAWKHRKIHLYIECTRHVFITSNIQHDRHNETLVCVFALTVIVHLKQWIFESQILSICQHYIESRQSSFCVSAYRLLCSHVDELQVYMRHIRWEYTHVCMCSHMSDFIQMIPSGRENKATKNVLWIKYKD